MAARSQYGITPYYRISVEIFWRFNPSFQGKFLWDEHLIREIWERYKGIHSLYESTHHKIEKMTNKHLACLETMNACVRWFWHLTMHIKLMGWWITKTNKNLTSSCEFFGMPSGKDADVPHCCAGQCPDPRLRNLHPACCQHGQDINKIIIKKLNNGLKKKNLTFLYISGRWVSRGREMKKFWGRGGGNS